MSTPSHDADGTPDPDLRVRMALRACMFRILAHSEDVAADTPDLPRTRRIIRTSVLQAIAILDGDDAPSGDPQADAATKRRLISKALGWDA